MLGAKQQDLRWEGALVTNTPFREPGRGAPAPPAGTSPVVTRRHSAISSLRASATIIVVLRAPLGPSVRVRYQRASALSFWNTRKRQGNWISPRRTRALPALASPFSRRFKPLVWGFLCQWGDHAIFVFLCHSILLFDPRRGHSSAPTAYFHRRRAQRWSRTALLQRRRRLVLDGREHGGRLPAIGWLAAR